MVDVWVLPAIFPFFFFWLNCLDLVLLLCLFFFYFCLCFASNAQLSFFNLLSSPDLLNLGRGAGVPAAPRGLPAAPRNRGQPISTWSPAAGQGRLAARQRQRGRGHLPHAHRVLLAHLHFSATVQPAPACQLLLPHRQGDAQLLRWAGRRADGRVCAHCAGGPHPQRDRRPHAGQRAETHSRLLNTSYN